jgi:hypothetical protein
VEWTDTIEETFAHIDVPTFFEAFRKVGMTVSTEVLAEIKKVILRNKLHAWEMITDIAQNLQLPVAKVRKIMVILAIAG